jgi:hypothetical protein
MAELERLLSETSAPNGEGGGKQEFVQVLHTGPVERGSWVPPR